MQQLKKHSVLQFPGTVQRIFDLFEDHCSGQTAAIVSIPQTLSILFYLQHAGMVHCDKDR